MSNSAAGEASNNQGMIKGNITLDGLIDDDFESELGAREATVSHTD